jgi:hypothetical protein
MSDTETSTPKVRLSDPRRLSDETGTPAINRTESTQTPHREIAVETRGATALAKVIEIDRLYEVSPGTSSQIVRALELLKQASDNLAEAQKSENPMEADRFVQRVQLVLPKLFAYRSIGDGFGVIINSLHSAFTNLRGTPLNPEQLNVVWRVLRELRTRPVMPLEQGIQRVEELEERGLEVDLPDLGDLLEEPESAENE